MRRQAGRRWWGFSAAAAVAAASLVSGLTPAGATPMRAQVEWATSYVCDNKARDLPILIGPSSDTDAAKAFQIVVRQMGYNPGAVNGRFGAKSRSASRLFQHRRELPRTKRVNTRTWRELQKVYCRDLD